MCKVCLFIATSIDGFIAKPNDDLSFLKLVEKEGEDYGYAVFTSTIDTIILGRKTYDYVEKHIGTAHYDNGDRDVYIITRTSRPQVGRTIFYSDDVKNLIEELKSKPGKNIYCDGGAELIHALLQHDLIDEMTISIVPIVLGEGVRLFKDGGTEKLFILNSVKHFDTGLVQVHYLRKKS
jgi:dihydrofolate reductase